MTLQIVLSQWKTRGNLVGMAMNTINDTILASAIAQKVTESILESLIFQAAKNTKRNCDK